MVATQAVWIIIFSLYVTPNSTCSAAKSRGQIPKITKSWKATQDDKGVVPKSQPYQTVYKLNDLIYMKGGKDYDLAWKMSTMSLNHHTLRLCPKLERRAKELP